MAPFFASSAARGHTFDDTSAAAMPFALALVAVQAFQVLTIMQQTSFSSEKGSDTIIMWRKKETSSSRQMSLYRAFASETFNLAQKPATRRALCKFKGGYDDDNAAAEAQLLGWAYP